MRWIAICALAMAVGLLAYVRLAPVDTGKVHRAGVARDVGDYPTAASFTAIRAITTPPQGALIALQRVATQTSRTKLVAGSVDEQMLTFETRSRVLGFPDYTTISIIGAGAAPSGHAGPLLMIRARTRFGHADYGVNGTRVTAWLEQLGPLIAPP